MDVRAGVCGRRSPRPCASRPARPVTGPGPTPSPGARCVPAALARSPFQDILFLAPGGILHTLAPPHAWRGRNMRGEGQNPNMRGRSFGACIVSGSELVSSLRGEREGRGVREEACGARGSVHDDTVTLMPPVCGLVTKVQELPRGRPQGRGLHRTFQTSKSCASGSFLSQKLL